MTSVIKERSRSSAVARLGPPYHLYPKANVAERKRFSRMTAVPAVR